MRSKGGPGPDKVKVKRGCILKAIPPRWPGKCLLVHCFMNHWVSTLVTRPFSCVELRTLYIIGEIESSFTPLRISESASWGRSWVETFACEKASRSFCPGAVHSPFIPSSHVFCVSYIQKHIGYPSPSRRPPGSESETNIPGASLAKHLREVSSSISLVSDWERDESEVQLIPSSARKFKGGRC